MANGTSRSPRRVQRPSTPENSPRASAARNELQPAAPRSVRSGDKGYAEAPVSSSPLNALGWQGGRWSGAALAVLSGYPMAISAITRITVTDRHIVARPGAGLCRVVGTIRRSAARVMPLPVGSRGNTAMVGPRGVSAVG